MDVGCPPKTASPPSLSIPTLSWQGSVMGFGGFFSAGHGNFNTSWRFSAWKPEPWKRRLTQKRPADLCWSRGAMGSKPLKKKVAVPANAWTKRKVCCLQLTVPKICLFYLFFWHVCHCSRYQVLFSTLPSDLGGFSFRMVLKMPLQLCRWQICWRGFPSDPGYPATDSAHGLGIDHRIHWSAPKWTCLSHLLNKLREFRRCVSNHLLWLERHAPQTGCFLFAAPLQFNNLACGKLRRQVKVGALKMYLLSKIGFSIAMFVYWRAAQGLVDLDDRLAFRWK